MYNRARSDDAATQTRLERRTRAFHQEADVADPASLDAFRARHTVQPEDKLLTGLANCPFLGLVDAASGRVGCLVHPLQNDGLDGRDCGVYDRHTCQDYLCAAHDVLREDERRLVVAAIDDSWLYGLVVTDPRFVRELFSLTASRAGAMPRRPATERPQALAAALAYFELKRDWPYRAPDAIFGQLRAGDGLDTPRRAGPSTALGVEPDPHEAVLRCLGTDVDDLAALAHARRLVSSRVEAFASACVPREIA